MKKPFLIGEKIYLRPLEPEDAPVLSEYINDPEVRATLQMYLPQTNAQTLAFVQGQGAGKSSADVVLGIALKENDRLIGATGLHELDWKCRRTSWGISIGAKDCWNKGCGTEAARLMIKYAFETLGLNRVYLRVYDYNPRAIRAYEKAGYKREGLLRQDHYHAGKFWDVWLMGILRSDYDAMQPTNA